MIHREGRRISIMLFIILAILNTAIIIFTGAPSLIVVPVIIASLLLWLFILRFFRDPERPPRKKGSSMHRRMARW